MKERERERERERGGVIKGFCEKKPNLTLLIKVTHQGLPSVIITPKSMTYRDTTYLKTILNPFLDTTHLKTMLNPFFNILL